jgi:ABC-2 type transport system permease protein
MIRHQLALIRREIWEHRSVYITPLAIAVLMTLAPLTGQVAISAYGSAVDLAMMTANEIDPRAHRAIINGFVIGIASVFLVATWILTVFYALDSLYAERKNKSILFWRSLPVTDTETVISKLLVALVVIPLVSFLAIIATQLVTLILTSIWLNFEGGNPSLIIWQPLNLLDIWVGTLIVVLAVPLWLSPLIGWFLFVSAFAKRAPLAFAFMPLFILPMAEKILLGSQFLARMFFVRTFNMPLFSLNGGRELTFFDLEDLNADQFLSLLSLIDLGKFFGNVSLWAGLLICAVFTAGAIYIRRYRDES